jgi:hypothetical protein
MARTTVPYGALECRSDGCDETLDWHDVDANVAAWGVFHMICVECVPYETVNECWLLWDE